MSVLVNLENQNRTIGKNPLFLRYIHIMLNFGKPDFQILASPTENPHWSTTNQKTAWRTYKNESIWDLMITGTYERERILIHHHSTWSPNPNFYFFLFIYYPTNAFPMSLWNPSASSCHLEFNFPTLVPKGQSLIGSKTIGLPQTQQTKTRGICLLLPSFLTPFLPPPPFLAFVPPPGR